MNLMLKLAKERLLVLVGLAVGLVLSMTTLCLELLSVGLLALLQTSLAAIGLASASLEKSLQRVASISPEAHQMVMRLVPQDVSSPKPGARAVSSLDLLSQTELLTAVRGLIRAESSRDERQIAEANERILSSAGPAEGPVENVDVEGSVKRSLAFVAEEKRQPEVRNQQLHEIDATSEELTRFKTICSSQVEQLEALRVEVEELKRFQLVSTMQTCALANNSPQH